METFFSGSNLYLIGYSPGEIKQMALLTPQTYCILCIQLRILCLICYILSFCCLVFSVIVLFIFTKDYCNLYKFTSIWSRASTECTSQLGIFRLLYVMKLFAHSYILIMYYNYINLSQQPYKLLVQTDHFEDDELSPKLAMYTSPSLSNPNIYCNARLHSKSLSGPNLVSPNPYKHSRVSVS